MKIALAYGRGHLDVEFPDDRTTIIEPSHQPGLADERAAMIAALDAPVGAAPLRTEVAGKKVVIVHTDITRATPNDLLIPWLLAYLEGAGARREDITLLNGLGTHRPNTQAEMEQMLTPAVVANYRCINHEPENDDAHVQFGVTRTGAPALINRHLAEADVRIITGFIEPHYFAGFSGGPKGIMPGVAALKTVMSKHGAKNIGDRHSTFGVTEGNPIWEEMRDIALRVGPSFLLNVALNGQRKITGIFAGDLIAAHRVVSLLETAREYAQRHAEQIRTGTVAEVVICALHEKLAVEGGSNSGLLMGAFLTQNPGLARAVVAHVGIYDMLRVELDPNGAFNVTEFGTVKDPAHYRALRAYSPFHNVTDGTNYPAVFFLAGEMDDRVKPANSRKMTARLHAATARAAASANPILVRLSGASGRGELSEKIAQ